MKKTVLISLTIFICCSAFSDDEDDYEDLIPPNREIIRSICIGMLHGGACFGVTLLLSLPAQILLPEFSQEDPYDGDMNAGIGAYYQVTLGAAQEEAFFRIVLQPVFRSFICNRLNQISNNNQRNTFNS